MHLAWFVGAQADDGASPRGAVLVWGGSACGGPVPGGQGYRPGWDSQIGTLLPTSLEPPRPFWLVLEREPLILPNPLLGWNIP